MVKSFKIVNVIASTSVQSAIDVEKLAMALKNVTYEPEIFPGLIYRRLSPKATIIMFASGKITSVGAKSEHAARESIKATVKEIKKLGALSGSCKLNPINTENVVGTLDLGASLDLNELALALPKALYETEQFPGLIYRPSLSNEVVLIFASGKIVATGAKSESRVRQLLKEVYETIKKY